MNLICMTGKHKWDGCKCSVCAKVREEGHDWSKDCEKCARCGADRNGVHKWSGCKCLKCSKTRDEGHEWGGCICSKCGNMRHEWTDGGLICSECGKRRDLIGKTIVVAKNSLVAPLNTACERDRSFRCLSKASYHDEAYDGVWLVDGTRGTTGSFVIEKVLE